MARRRKAKAAKRATTKKNFFTKEVHLSVSVISAAVVILILLFVMFAAGGPAGLQQGAKVVKYTSPAEVVKATAPQQTQPATQTAPAPTSAPTAVEKLPDLQLQLFSTYSGETKQAIRITTDAFNKGDADLASGYIVTYGYDKKIGTNRIDYVKVGDYGVKGTHKAGTTKTFAFLWAPEEAGVFDFKVCADYENTVKESNEENNCAKSTVTVKDFGKYG